MTTIEYLNIDELTIEHDSRVFSLMLMIGAIVLTLLAATGILPFEGSTNMGLISLVMVGIVVFGLFFDNQYYKILINRKTGRVTVKRVQMFVITKHETFNVQQIRLRKERDKDDGSYVYNAYLNLGNQSYNFSNSSDESDMLSDYEMIKNFLEEAKANNTTTPQA